MEAWIISAAVFLSFVSHLLLALLWWIISLSSRTSGLIGVIARTACWSGFLEITSTLMLSRPGLYSTSYSNSPNFNLHRVTLALGSFFDFIQRCARWSVIKVNRFPNSQCLNYSTAKTIARASLSWVSHFRSPSLSVRDMKAIGRSTPSNSCDNTAAIPYPHASVVILNRLVESG